MFFLYGRQVINSCRPHLCSWFWKIWREGQIIKRLGLVIAGLTPCMYQICYRTIDGGILIQVRMTETKIKFRDYISEKLLHSLHVLFSASLARSLLHPPSLPLYRGIGGLILWAATTMGKEEMLYTSGRKVKKYWMDSNITIKKV